MPNKKTRPLAVVTAPIHTSQADAVAEALSDAAHETPDVFRDHNSHCVCVYNRGPVLTHFLGIDGPQLNTQKLSHAEFAAQYDRPLKTTAVDFARCYTKSETAISMIPISGTAFRVLKAILAGQQVNADEEAPDLTHLEKHMSNEEAGFRKPDGPVAKVHAFLDKQHERIKAGTVSRKDMIEKMVGSGLSQGTVVTQAGVWARNNGITFARPTAAAGAVKEARAKTAKKAKKAAS